MKWSVIIVFLVLISVTYGTKYCDLKQKENEICGNNGKCTTPTCVPAPGTTTPAPGTTTPAPAKTTTPATAKTTPATAKTTPATAKTTPTTAKTTTATAKTTTAVAGRKRRAVTVAPDVAKCKTRCAVCKYQCTGESGSIKHGLSPLVLLVGVLTKLFLVG